MQFKVSFDDGRTLEITPTPGDLVRFERQYGFAVSKIEHDPRMEYVMYLSWVALKRTGEYTDDFEVFLDHIVQSEEAAVVPPATPPV